MSDQHLLEVRDLVVRFRTHDGAVHAVNGVSFDLAAGETLGIAGESGCGKSVTNLAIVGLLPKPAGRVEGGNVRLAGRELTTLKEEELRQVRGSEIAMIFQDPMTSLNPVLRIEEQLIETIQAHREVTKEAARARAIELLAAVGVANPESRLRSYPHEFSGGMRQRVMSAMALALEPRVLIADEPTTALDVTIQAQVLDLLRRLTEERGTATILVTHDLGVLAGMADRVNVMYAGAVIESGTTDDLFANPRHPYTVGLLRSIPRLDGETGGKLVPIEGRPPDLVEAPIGCSFYARCAWRTDHCASETPSLKPIDGGTGPIVTSGPAATHVVACFNPVAPVEVAEGRPLPRAGGSTK
ncbi:MAG: ABC transporter ATP-binding protein [Candidatus Limnocylindrus sp.]